MKKRAIQYTIRGVPERVDASLRESAAQYGESLNQAALVALSKGLGIEGAPALFHDLDDLAGTWVRDESCEKALAERDRVDAELWS